jgi:hypothetical protein
MQENSEIRQDPTFRRHVARLRSSLAAHSTSTILDFLEQHTKLRGKPFSFEGHEYQKEILSDQAQNIVILKSAQIGISEMSARLALAKSVLIPGFSTIYTLPSAMAAQNFMKSRIAPIVDSSPYLSELVAKDVDNTSIKRFGDSWLYLKGCQTDSQALSVPADLLVSDEVDNSSLDVMTLFESRLIHSPYQLTVKLSTPTIPEYGISKMYAQSKRKLNLCKCSKCNTWFYPEYFEHVKIPGYDDDLKAITKLHFADVKFKWQEAYVACPKCGCAADLTHTHRSWVVENPDDAFINSGYRISPFDCPTVIKTSALVKAYPEYERPADFYNQRLGIPLADADTSLSEDELNRAIIGNFSSSFNFVMGIDLGNTCWATIAAVLPDNTLIIVKTEGIPMHLLVDRYQELARQYRVRMTVIDSAPYTETVYRIQQLSPNVYASVYVQSKSVELFKVKEEEEDGEKGRGGVRQVNVARDRGFDLLMDLVRLGQIHKVSDDNDRIWKTHLTDQKRTKVFRNNELVSVWVKTSGQDHLAHSLLYALVASRILGKAAGYGIPLPLISTFKVEEPLT